MKSALQDLLVSEHGLDLVSQCVFIALQDETLEYENWGVDCFSFSICFYFITR